MAEVITEDQPRIKFRLRRTGAFALPAAAASDQLAHLCGLMAEMEAAGAAPILDDGKVGRVVPQYACVSRSSPDDAVVMVVNHSPTSPDRVNQVGGNCAMVLSLASNGAHGPPPAAAATGSSITTSSTTSSTSTSSTSILVSRSGKAPGARLTPPCFVRVTAFDRSNWAADFESRDEETRPSSDSPLLWACLAPAAAELYGWGRRPRVALHGHALESGAGAC
jgi:hypothetical protein